MRPVRSRRDALVARGPGDDDDDDVELPIGDPGDDEDWEDDDYDDDDEEPLQVHGARAAVPCATGSSQASLA